MATAKKSAEDYIIDFQKEETAASGNNMRVKKGTYKAKVLSAKMTTSSKGTLGLEVTFVFVGGRYNKKKFKDTLWWNKDKPATGRRFRGILEATGQDIPKKLDMRKVAAAIKGETLYLEIDIEKSEGYSDRSRVAFDGFISEEDYEPDDEEDDEDDEDEDEDEEADDDDEADEDDDEEEDEDEDEDDDDDEEEEPVVKKKLKTTATKKKAAPAKKRKAKADDDDDDLELDDL